MLSNEIKREAFSYVIRMKYSELLSSSMHFVTERSQWEKHKRSWRTAEVKLLALVKRLRKVSAVSEADVADQTQGTGLHRETSGEASLARHDAARRAKEHAIERAVGTGWILLVRQ